MQILIENNSIFNRIYSRINFFARLLWRAEINRILSSSTDLEKVSLVIASDHFMNIYTHFLPRIMGYLARNVMSLCTASKRNFIQLENHMVGKNTGYMCKAALFLVARARFCLDFYTRRFIFKGFVGVVID